MQSWRLSLSSLEKWLRWRYMHVCVCRNMYRCVCGCAWVGTHTYKCVWMYMCGCTHGCVHVCVQSMLVCMCVCLCSYGKHQCQTSQTVNEICHEMWVWSVASPSWGRVYPLAWHAPLFSAQKSWNFRPHPTMERLLSVRGGGIQHSRTFFLPFSSQIVTFQGSQNGLPSVVWLGQFVMLTDSNTVRN